ncbi:MAG TPA: ThuA domain-containing protein [Clostridia bacterium]|jgi:trehalose utilization protein|nr:ThuA domain-containing protein [Clostridia bacterium]
MNVTIFNEYHEKQRKGKAARFYPNGIHIELKKYLNVESSDLNITTITQEDPGNGFTKELLDNTDVLVWWSDVWNEQVLNDVVTNVTKRVKEGMGLVALYGANQSRVFKSLLGTTCLSSKDNKSTTVKLISLDPKHPICKDVKFPVTFRDANVLTEPFDVPAPETAPIISWFSTGNVLRALMTFKVGKGKVVYFYGGSDTSDSYLNVNVKKLISNSIKYVAPKVETPEDSDQNANVKDAKKTKRSIFKRK